ncbi:MAG: hypothetical protein K9W42_05255 [Candidatus Heimdallarchaeota archaeon]|nr:hypothetical protein [Candidatus Heimdallarchaeota archaeon]
MEPTTLPPKVFSVVSSFADKGMRLAHNYQIPNITTSELQIIANYYSIILNKNSGTESLYGPLPVTYHTEYLLYVFTFTIKDRTIKDPRIIENDYLVPANLLIFFPTTLEPLANAIREKIFQGVKIWKAKFQDICNISQERVNKLNFILNSTIAKEAANQKMSETEKTIVVLSKSIELLYNISNYNEDQVKILIASSDDSIFNLARTAFISKNAKFIDALTIENNIFRIQLGNLHFKIIKLEREKPNIQKFLSNDLSGIVFFGDFSTKELADSHAKQLEEIIKGTNSNCLISFAITQTKAPFPIEESKLPHYLSKGRGRIISLFDLASENMNTGMVIIESLNKFIDVSARVK